MAIVYAPGEIVEAVFPEDLNKPADEQTIVVMKVPDEGTQRKLLRLQFQQGDPMDKLRTIFGLQVEEVRNLKMLKGGKLEDFVLEKDGDGRVTARSMTTLAWKAEQVQLCLAKLTHVSRDDLKNS